MSDKSWTIDGPHFRLADPASEPALVTLWSELARTDGRPSRDLLERHDLRALPLIEWGMSDWASELFELLRDAGSTRGFLLDSPQLEEMGELHELKLDPGAAATVLERQLIDFHWMFVDDKVQCIILPWYTDMVFFCLARPLLDRFLKTSKIDFSLDGNGTISTDFDSALRAAFKRDADWAGCDAGARDASYLEAVRAELEWQLD